MVCLRYILVKMNWKVVLFITQEGKQQLHAFLYSWNELMLF